MSATASTGSGSAYGRYRIRESVSLAGDLLILPRPLAVTRLNPTARRIIDVLPSSSFVSVGTIAEAVGSEPTAVADLLDALHDRGFLQWRPARKSTYRPAVTVVVTVRNAARDLQECLDALAALEYPEYEVVVVDDGSTDGSRNIVTDHPIRPRLVRVGGDEQPIGIGASRNRGVEAAEHEIVAFTDSDCRPDPGWLDKLVPCLAAHDVVGGRVRPRNQTGASAYEAVNSSLDMGERAARVDPADGTPYLPTANLVSHRAVLLDVGFPDRDIAEDVGFCWRARDTGYDVVYEPAGIVEHVYGTEGPGFTARRRSYGSSEALLATAFDKRGRVPVPGMAAVVVIIALILGVSPRIQSAVPYGLLGLGAGIAGAFGLRGILAVLRARHRTRGRVATIDILASLGRRAVSTTYAIAREVTRYYSLPLGALAAGLAFVHPTVGETIALFVVSTVAVPAVVEYAVHRPAIGPIGYGGWYLRDHFAYQIGAYRGALRHRTVRHLGLHRRFALSRPVAGK